MKCCRPDFDTFFILMFFHKAFATAFAGSWRSSSIEGKAVQGRPWDCGGPFVEWYCRRTPGNPDGSSFKWIYKKKSWDGSNGWIWDGPFGFVMICWASLHLYGSLRSLSSCQAAGRAVAEVWPQLGAPSGSHLFVMFSCGLCPKWKINENHGMAKRRQGSRRPWNGGWLGLLTLSETSIFWRSSPLRMAIWLNPHLLGQAWAGASRSQAGPLYVSAVNQLLKPETKPS